MSPIPEQLGVGGPLKPKSKVELSRGRLQIICYICLSASRGTEWVREEREEQDIAGPSSYKERYKSLESSAAGTHGNRSESVKKF